MAALNLTTGGLNLCGAPIVPDTPQDEAQDKKAAQDAVAEQQVKSKSRKTSKNG